MSISEHKIPFVIHSHYSKLTLYAWFAVIFLLSEFLGTAFGYGVESISILWPPTGILGATLAMLHRKHWIPILLIGSVIDFFAGVVSHNFLIDPHFVKYLFIGLISNPFTAIFFATTFQWLIPNAHPLSDPKRFGFYVLIPIVLNTAIVSFLSMNLLAVFIHDFPVIAAWQQWLYSDITGLLTFATPLIMIVSSWDQILKIESRLYETALMMVVFAVVTAILFTDILEVTYFRNYMFVMMLPMFAWIVARSGAVGMSLATLILTIVVLAALVNHSSPFEVPDRTAAENVLVVQGFLVPITLVILFVASILESRKTQFEQLLEQDRQLRNMSRIESLGTMAGGVAHDFGNLAIAMRAYHAVLRVEINKPNQAVIDAIQGLEVAADGAQVLTSSLMAFAREDQHEKSVVTESIDLCAAIQAAVSTIKPLIVPKYSLDLNMPSEPVYILANDPSIKRVLGNLILNARDASDVGQKIEICVVPFEESVLLVVSDQGCGISVADQDRIFDPFFTTKPRGQGTGLGLAVVAGILREIGSTINVTSTEGIGTTFTIRFPITSSPEES